MAVNDYSMGKYMQSQQNPCKLDGLGKRKDKVSQCYVDRWSEQDDELQKVLQWNRKIERWWAKFRVDTWPFVEFAV